MHRIAPSLCMASLLLATGANAEDTVFPVGPVEVVGRRLATPVSTTVFTSVDLLGADTIEHQRVNNTWELMGLMPGVMLTNFNQGTTSGKFSFRGFNGEGEINAVKLLIDGIPSNSNDGNMPYIDAVFPLDIESIETVRGTNDPRYGLHNIAGNASINTRIGGDYTRAALSYGSFETFDVQAAKGIEIGGFSQSYFVGTKRSDGHRDHSEWDKYVLSGKWFYRGSNDRYGVGLIVRHFDQDAEEPGYLTRADARRDPEQSYAFSATDGDKRKITQVSAHAYADLTEQLHWTGKTYLNLLDDRRFVKFSAGVSQQERYADEQQIGALTSLTWRPKISALKDFALEVGMDMERQDNISQRYLTIQRVRQSQTRDQDFEFDVYGAYVQAVIKPTDALTLVPAFRMDWVNGSFTNELTNARYPINHYGPIPQPKFSVIYAFDERYSVYGNWGRTYQVGLAAGAYKIPPRTTDLAPSINEGWEAGVKFAPARWLDGRIAYWEQTASDEVRRKLNDPLGDSDNLGETKRRGVDVQANLRPSANSDLWIAYAWQDAEITDPGPSDPTSKGNQIDHIPHHLFSSGINVHPNEALRLSAWVNAQSNYYLEKSNATGRFGSLFLLNLAASYQLTRYANVELQLKNVTDKYYEYVWWDGTQTLHSPGAGRSLYATLNLRF